MTRKIWWSGAWADLGGGGGGSSWPSNTLPDVVSAANSSRAAPGPILASATPHTFGAWLEIDASLSADSDGIFVFLVNNFGVGATDTSGVLQIGLGTAGAEVPWVSQLVGYSVAGATLWFPGRIPAGSRVAARLQSIVASKNLGTTMWSFLPAKSATSLGAPVSYGVNLATSMGVLLTAPGSLNTKGAWTQIVASTSTDLAALTFGVQGAGSTSMAGASTLVDIGVGPASSEVVVIGDVHVQGGTGESYDVRSPVAFEVDIPAGSRISARYARANVANAIDLALVGAPPG